jgi:SAM-dependent methyltransferase
MQRVLKYINDILSALKGEKDGTEENLKELARLQHERDMLRQQVATLKGHFSDKSRQMDSDLVPPEEMISIGSGDFMLIGHEFVQLFTGLAGLMPYESVLDVGCGIGRMAIALTKYMDTRGRYEGFDVASEGINWCQENITPRYPNFRLQFADIRNKAYNPDGKYTASEYKFPYDNGVFDFVFLTSVFTHMLPDDMDHYLSEISRVLKKNGRCFITFFLLNPASLKMIDENSSTIDFNHVFSFDLPLIEGAHEYRTSDENTHETAIAYDEQVIRRLYKKHGLNIIEPFRYGSWCGRKIFISYQDIIVAYKKQ